eukprot:RCo036779
MPIVYAAIAHSKSVFAGYPERRFPHLEETCQKIVASVPGNEPVRKFIEVETFTFYYKGEGERVYICAAHKDVPMRVAFSFLESVAEKLPKDFNRPVKVLTDCMAFHNDPANDKIQRLQMDLDDVREDMMRNIDLALARGAKLDILVDRSRDLAVGANMFQAGASDLRRQYCRKHAKMVAIIVTVALVLIIIVLMMACNPNFSRCR